MGGHPPAALRRAALLGRPLAEGVGCLGGWPAARILRSEATRAESGLPASSGPGTAACIGLVLVLLGGPMDLPGGIRLGEPGLVMSGLTILALPGQTDKLRL